MSQESLRQLPGSLRPRSLMALNPASGTNRMRLRKKLAS